MRHGGWEYVVEFEVPVCGEIRVSTVEFVGPQQKKMTRLGFEPRTSWLYTGCSNH